MSQLVNHISSPSVYSHFPRWILTGVSDLGILTWLLILRFCLQFVWKMLCSSTFLFTVLLYVTWHCSLRHFSWLNTLINSPEYRCGIWQWDVTVAVHVSQSGFSEEVYCFSVHKSLPVWRVLLGVNFKNLFSVNSSAHSLQFLFSLFVTNCFPAWVFFSVAGLTSLNPVKGWIFEHPTHQRFCMPANYLAFSLWLWVFLSWHHCCTVKKFQEFICCLKKWDTNTNESV